MATVLLICSVKIVDGEAKVGKHLIEAVDEEKNMITFKEIEGDQLKNYKNFKCTLQAIPKGKGSVIHYTIEYEKLHENIGDSHSLLQFLADTAKDIDAHLMGGN